MERPLKVLVIEGKLVVALELAMRLEEMDCSVCAIAHTQSEAVLEARLHHPDLITADVLLHDGDGISAVREIWLEDHIPVIFVTRFRSYIEALMPRSTVVEKPVHGAALAAAIDSLRSAPKSAAVH